MYSVILVAALATSGEAPSHCYARHCHNSCGCYGGYSGYSGYSGYGHGCHGCHGGHGPIGYGCAGGCYGYHGGCYGGFGVFSGGDAYHLGCTGCYGCYGGYACYGVPLPIAPAAEQLPTRDPFPPIKPDVQKKPEVEEVPQPKEKEKKAEPKKNLEEESVRAKITIEVPEGAKLFVDGQHIKTAAGTRIFQTPDLKQGETYFYDIRIEHGTASEQRRVFVRAGQEVAVQFPKMGTTGTLTAQSPR